MNDFITQQFSSYNLFQAAGDVVELNAWVHDDILDQIKQLNEDPTKIKQHRIKDSKDGPENGYWYNNVPDGWGLPQNARNHLPLELKMMSRVSPVNEYHRTYNE